MGSIFAVYTTEDGIGTDTIVRDFKLKLRAAAAIPDIKKGIVHSVIVDVPETVFTALALNEYEEKVKDNPEIFGGHTQAEYDRADGALEGVDIASLLDGNNDILKERAGLPDSITIIRQFSSIYKTKTAAPPPGKGTT